MAKPTTQPRSAFARLAQIAKGIKPDAPPEEDKDDNKIEDTDDDKKKNKNKKKGDTDDDEDEEARATRQAALIVKAGQVRRAEVPHTFKPPAQPVGVVATPEGILAAGRKARGEK